MLLMTFRALPRVHSRSSTSYPSTRRRHGGVDQPLLFAARHVKSKLFPRTSAAVEEERNGKAAPPFRCSTLAAINHHEGRPWPVVAEEQERGENQPKSLSVEKFI